MRTSYRDSKLIHSSLFIFLVYLFYAESACTGTNRCDQHATCTPSGTCTCNSGYIGSGRYCYVDMAGLTSGTCRLTRPMPYWFNCINGTCLDITLIRDTYNDCSDGEDEACDATNGEIRCDTNLCVKAADVATLCTSGKLYDKLYCLYFNMTPSFTCADESMCMPYAWVNNGYCNCKDCSDEGVTTSTTKSTIYNKYNATTGLPKNAGNFKGRFFSVITTLLCVLVNLLHHRNF